MNIIIEHSGTEDHLQLVEGLRDQLEDELGHDTEEVIRNLEPAITLYNQNRSVIAIFTKLPTVQELAFYVNISGDD
jgi:hypothetical protein